jgi:hypothetical protein
MGREREHDSKLKWRMSRSVLGTHFPFVLGYWVLALALTF